jgi:hypothetical protein
MLAFYRALLRLYPAAYRCEFGDEMTDVLLQVQAKNRMKGALAVFFSGARETGGLLFGAAREHFYGITGSHSNGMFSFNRRFAMKSEFRFPKATVGLMTVILAAVIMTIEKARAISSSWPHVNPPLGPIQSVQAAVAQTMLGVLVWAIVCGAIGWGILYALRRTGIQQLSEMKPSAGQRSNK